MRTTSNPGSLTAARADHDPGGLRLRPLRAGLGHELGHREPQLAQPFGGGGGDLVDAEPARARSRAVTSSASSRASGTSTLFSATSRGRPDSGMRRRPRRCQAGAGHLLVRRELGLDRVQVGDRVAAGLDRWRSRARAPARSSARRAAGSRGRGPCPRWRRGSAPARRRRRTGLAGLDDAEVGDQGREGIVRDLRPGGGHGRDQRRLARVGEADQTDVGDRLQLEGRARARPPAPP